MCIIIIRIERISHGVDSKNDARSCATGSTDIHCQ